MTELSRSQMIVGLDFYSHLPEAIAAVDPPHLESAWASAMVVVSGCARDAMRDYFAFLDISETAVEATAAR